MRKFVLLLPILLLAACASREARIESALVDAGIPPSMAECMASPLAKDLSNDQLKRLARASGADGTYPRDASEALRRLDLDSRTIAVVVRASVGCLLP